MTSITYTLPTNKKGMVFNHARSIFLYNTDRTHQLHVIALYTQHLHKIKYSQLVLLVITASKINKAHDNAEKHRDSTCFL